MAALHGYWEEDGEERSARERERDKGKEREGGVQVPPGGPSRPPSGKQEVAHQRPCAGHAGVLPTGRRRKKVFAENPLGFGRFLDRIETESFAIFGTSNGVQKFRNLIGAF
jgi:hypothetical protein